MGELRHSITWREVNQWQQYFQWESADPETETLDGLKSQILNFNKRKEANNGFI